MAPSNLKISKILYDLGGKLETFQAYVNVASGTSEQKSFNPETGKVFIPLKYTIGLAVNYYIKFSIQFDSTYTYKDIRVTDAVRGNQEFELYTPVKSIITITITNEDSVPHIVDMIITGVTLNISNEKLFFDLLDSEEKLLDSISTNISNMDLTLQKLQEIQLSDMESRGIDTRRLLEQLEKLSPTASPDVTGPAFAPPTDVPHSVDEKPYIIQDGRLEKVE